MDENKLIEKEYDRAQNMIIEKNTRVWQLFGFLVTINLAYLGSIFYFLVNHISGFQNVLNNGEVASITAYGLALFFASFIILIINIIFANIWLREHYTVKGYFKQLNWIREYVKKRKNISLEWYFDDEGAPERGKTFQYIVFVFMFFLFIPFILSAASLLFYLVGNSIVKYIIIHNKYLFPLILMLLIFLSFIISCLAGHLDKEKNYRKDRDFLKLRSKYAKGKLKCVCKMFLDIAKIFINPIYFLMRIYEYNKYLNKKE